MRRFVLCAVLALGALTPFAARAQVNEGGDQADVSVQREFPGLMAALTNGDVLREISKITGRGGAELKDIKMTEVGLKKRLFRFQFAPKNGAFIGSSSFTAEVVYTGNGGDTRVSVQREPDLELPQGR